jgi:hypothetical protein
VSARAPRFPIYVVSKNRAETATTPKVLDALGVPFRLVVEADQADDYAAALPPAGELLVLDPSYLRDYDTFDDLGDAKPKGPGAARNFAWEHSLADGAPWHWVLDDNIALFARLHRNERVPVGDGTIFHAIETFCLRYENVGMAGPHYWMFAPSRAKRPPFTTGTRIYSCNLIRNDVELRWRGRYNEDTDLSLRMLKTGWLTVLFNAFLQYKLPTQTLDGGCTTDFYAVEGTLPKSQMQVAMHPDVSKLVWRFGRWHHSVDYSRFRKLRLVRRADWSPEEEAGIDYTLTKTSRASRISIRRASPSPKKTARARPEKTAARS